MRALAADDCDLRLVDFLETEHVAAHPFTFPVRLWPLIGGGALFVSFTAQYAYLVAVRRQAAASVIEALLLDLLSIIQTSTGLEKAAGWMVMAFTAVGVYMFFGSASHATGGKPVPLGPAVLRARDVRKVEAAA